MSIVQWDKSRSYQKWEQSSATTDRHQRKKDRKDALEAAYEAVDARGKPRRGLIDARLAAVGEARSATSKWGAFVGQVLWK